MLDKTDQKHNLQRKKQRDSCLVQSVPRSVCSNVCANITARHPVSAGVFHIKKCQVRSQGGDRCELEQGNWRDCARRRVDGFTCGDHLLETCSSTQQIVALSTAASEYISIPSCAAHAPGGPQCCGVIWVDVQRDL